MRGYSLTVFNAETNAMSEYRDSAQSVTYTTNRTGSPGKLTFECVADSLGNLTEGAQVQLTVNGRQMFKGYIFTVQFTRWGVFSITAYDQIRYLKANASYSFVGKSLDEIIQQIAADFRLEVGTLDDTGYVIPTLTKEDKSCMDIIDYGLAITQNNTGRTFVFYDDFGRLSLQEAIKLKSMDIIGDSSLLTEYTYKSDIDSGTYNRVKLARPNKETGKADIYQFEDSATQQKWGLLQYYKKVDENLNEAQIEQQGNMLMAYYNRVLKTINVDAMGSPDVRAGSVVCFRISDIPELKTGYFLLADKVTHKFENKVHTMSIEARILTI